MAFDSSKVDTGVGVLYVAPIGTTEPTTASAALPSAWLPLGYTSDGVKLKYDLRSEPIDVDQQLDPLFYETVSREGSLSTNLAEVSLANLAVALNQGSGYAGTSIEPPTPGNETRLMVLYDTDATYANANTAPGSSNSRWLGRRCLQSGTIEITRKKAPEKALIPVEFRFEIPTGGGQPFICIGSSTGRI